MNVMQTQTNVYNFLSQFGTVYMKNQVPSANGLVFPHLTYEFDIENWKNDGVGQIRIYDKSGSTKKAFQIAEDIEDVIGDGYVIENLIMHAGSPFIQIIEQEDINIKCLYVNLTINYL